MRAHYFQHVPFEGLGSIESWLKSREYQLSATHFYDSPELPDIETIDFLIILGGPMSINDEAAFPWLVAEKQFIRQMIASGKPVLGICLGAQLIANAMNAKVYQSAEKEIGWWPIRAVETDANVFRFPPNPTVFHWHGETFDLPVGAVRLAESEACAHQAFQLGSSVLGLQFHLETTAESASAILANCGEELQPAKYIQSESEMKSVPVQRYQHINQLMFDVLDYLHHAHTQF